MLFYLFAALLGPRYINSFAGLLFVRCSVRALIHQFVRWFTASFVRCSVRATWMKVFSYKKNYCSAFYVSRKPMDELLVFICTFSLFPLSAYFFAFLANLCKMVYFFLPCPHKYPWSYPRPAFYVSRDPWSNHDRIFILLCQGCIILEKSRMRITRTKLRH